MIFFGSTGREIQLSQGQFYCSTCQATRTYQHFRSARYFTLYFIPLFQVEKLGEYIRCQACQNTFPLSSLNYRPPTAEQKLLIDTHTELESGLPLHMMRNKLIARGIDPDLAEMTVQKASTHAQVTCSSCGFIYLRSVQTCLNCGSRLPADGALK